MRAILEKLERKNSMAIIKKHELKQLIESQIDDKLTELKKTLLSEN